MRNRTTFDMDAAYGVSRVVTTRSGIRPRFFGQRHHSLEVRPGSGDPEAETGHRRG
ncbi:hypothetical protein [Nocardioides insulae]|uniref:hypothetical protein n=1 Tax=Nocardioides insulae TaxID=394734 RepID=UPI000403C820|nr:hypothetical protein [Nocardioides insulae]